MTPRETAAALASALPDSSYVLEHLDAYEEPMGNCILLGDLPMALAESGYVLLHSEHVDDATVERVARAIHSTCYDGVLGFNGHMEADRRAALAALTALAAPPADEATRAEVDRG